MLDSIVKGLEAYCLGSMAKDLGSRYSNPGRVIRNTTNMVEAINLVKAGGVAQDNALAMLALVNAAKGSEAAQPAVKAKDDTTAKDFYSFRKQQYAVNKAILSKLDDLAPSVPATTP